MSKVKIEGNASGTGTLTIAAPNTNTDRTLTLPDADITLGGGVDGLDSDYTSGTAVKIDSSGRVGIGTSSPMVALNVHDSTNARIALTNSSTGQTFPDGFELLATGLDAYVQNRSNGNMVFTTNNTERMRIDSSGNLKFNSGYGSAATAYGVRVWCNYNGSTNSINGSGNASSITDNGAGDQTVNFSTSLPDTVYATVIGGARNTGAYEAAFMTHSFTQSTSSVRILTAKSDQTQADHTQISIACIR